MHKQAKQIYVYYAHTAATPSFGRMTVLFRPRCNQTYYLITKYFRPDIFIRIKICVWDMAECVLNRRAVRNEKIKKKNKNIKETPPLALCMKCVGFWCVEICANITCFARAQNLCSNRINYITLEFDTSIRNYFDDAPPCTERAHALANSGEQRPPNYKLNRTKPVDIRAKFNAWSFETSL